MNPAYRVAISYTLKDALKKGPDHAMYGKQSCLGGDIITISISKHEIEDYAESKAVINHHSN
jgi:hypothetical protein